MVYTFLRWRGDHHYLDYHLLVDHDQHSPVGKHRRRHRSSLGNKRHHDNQLLDDHQFLDSIFVEHSLDDHVEQQHDDQLLDEHFIFDSEHSLDDQQHHLDDFVDAGAADHLQQHDQQYILDDHELFDSDFIEHDLNDVLDLQHLDDHKFVEFNVVLIDDHDHGPSRGHHH